MPKTRWYRRGAPKPQQTVENVQGESPNSIGSDSENSDSTSSGLSWSLLDLRSQTSRETSPQDDATLEPLMSHRCSPPITKHQTTNEQSKANFPAGMKDYAAAVEDLRQRFAAKGIEAKATKLEQALIPISGFVTGLTGICQAADCFKIGQAVGGALQSIIKLAFRFIDLVDTITTYLEDLAKSLPRIQDFGDLFPNPSVKGALKDIGDVCAEFLLKVATYLGRSPLHITISLQWSAPDQELRAIRDKINRRKQDFLHEVELNFMRTTASDLRRLHVKEIPRQIEATAPAPSDLARPVSGCKKGSYPPKARVIPFGENKNFYPRPSITSKVAEHLISNQGFQAVLLHGTGGFGKTQLAMNFVYSHVDKFDVVLWIGAETQQTMTEGFLKAATELHLPQAEGDVSNYLFKNLEKNDWRWLVVFDNADDPDILHKHWPQVTKGSVLVTSRDPMYHINLAVSRYEVGSLNKEEGEQMLLSMLSSSGCSAAMTDPHLAPKVALQSGGVPLMISMIAGYILQHQMNMERFLAIFSEKDQADAITSSITSIDRQYSHTMATVWRMSYEKLPADAFKMLGVSAFFFPDEIPETPFVMNRSKKRPSLGITGIPFEPIFGNESSFEEALCSLLRQSLLRRNPGGKRSLLSVHRKLQENIRGQISKEDQPRFLELFEMAVKMLYHEFPRQSPLGEPIPDWPTCEFYTKHVIFLLERYEEYPVLQNASSIMALCTELFCDCGVYLWARGRLSDAQRLATASINIADRVLPASDCLRAQPYTLLGCIYLRSENCVEEAGSALEMALNIRKSNLDTGFDENEIPRHDEIQLANAYSNLGIQRKQAGNYAEAAELHIKSLSIKQKFRHDGDMHFLMAISYCNLGKVRQLQQGQMELAAKLFKESVNTMERLGNEMGNGMLSRKAIFMCSRAEAHESLGETEEAGDDFSRAIEILKSTVGDAPDTAYACFRFAGLLYRRGHYEEALPRAENAVGIYSSSCLISDMKLVHTHWLLCLIYSKLGNAKKSAEYESRTKERLGDWMNIREDAWERSCTLLVHD